MQEPVDRQMAEVMIERLLLVIGLFARGLVGGGDIAEHPRRVSGAPAVGCSAGDDNTLVGVDAAPVIVERADAASSVSITASSASPTSAA